MSVCTIRNVELLSTPHRRRHSSLEEVSTLLADSLMVKTDHRQRSFSDSNSSRAAKSPPSCEINGDSYTFLLFKYKWHFFNNSILSPILPALCHFLSFLLFLFISVYVRITVSQFRFDSIVVIIIFVDKKKNNNKY